MEKVIPCKWEPKERRVAILISDKIDFQKKKKVTRDKESHYMMRKEPIHQEDMTIKNTHAPNI